VEDAREELEADDGVDDDDEHDEQHDVEEGDEGHQDGVQHNLQTCHTARHRMCARESSGKSRL